MLVHSHFDYLSDMSTSYMPLFIQRSEYVVPYYVEYQVPLANDFSSREGIGVWTYRSTNILLIYSPYA